MMVSPNEKSLNAKADIFEATVRLMQGKDYNTLTMRGLCEEAGISNGTLYHYFKSKDEILAFSLCYIYEKFLKTAEVAASSPQEKVLNLYLYVARQFEQFGIGFVSYFLDVRNQALNVEYLLRSEENGRIARYFISNLQALSDQKLLQKDADVLKVYDDLNIIFYGTLFYWGLRGGDFDLSERMRSILTNHFNQFLRPKCRLK